MHGAVKESTKDQDSERYPAGLIPIFQFRIGSDVMKRIAALMVGGIVTSAI
jgi:Cu/Ag efflux pump CusA